MINRFSFQIKQANGGEGINKSIIQSAISTEEITLLVLLSIHSEKWPGSQYRSICAEKTVQFIFFARSVRWKWKIPLRLVLDSSFVYKRSVECWKRFLYHRYGFWFHVVIYYRVKSTISSVGLVIYSVFLKIITSRFIYNKTAAYFISVNPQIKIDDDWDFEEYKEIGSRLNETKACKFSTY